MMGSTYMVFYIVKHVSLRIYQHCHVKKYLHKMLYTLVFELMLIFFLIKVDAITTVTSQSY